MTGEVSSIKPNGEDSNGDIWGVHAYVAKALRCKLRPFDTYIGPYIDHKLGRIFIGSDDGGVGDACLWPGGVPPAYCKPITEQFFPMQSEIAALDAVRSVLREARKANRRMQS